jgi:hypothetical protein
MMAPGLAVVAGQGVGEVEGHPLDVQGPLKLPCV